MVEVSETAVMNMAAAISLRFFVFINKMPFGVFWWCEVFKSEIAFRQ
jgi:hypothetical protein